jgi:hypothetical protein
MTGIAEYFAELSQPDFYDVSAQLELFCWKRRMACRTYQQRYAAKESADPVKLEARRARQRAYQARLRAKRAA